MVDVYYFGDFRGIKLTEFNQRYLPWTLFWQKRIEFLNRLRAFIGQDWEEFVKRTDPYLKFEKGLINKIDKNLKSTSRLLDDLKTSVQDNYLSSSSKGRGLKPLNLLFFVWSHFFRDRDNRKVHINQLLQLLRWLSSRIGRFYFFKEEDVEDDNLTKALFRFRMGRIASAEEKVERFKKRFCIPGNNNILIKEDGPKKKSDISLIIFSNGQELRARDYVENKRRPSRLVVTAKKPFKPIVLDFKSLSLNSDSWLWQVRLLRELDKYKD